MIIASSVIIVHCQYLLQFTTIVVYFDCFTCSNEEPHPHSFLTTVNCLTTFSTDAVPKMNGQVSGTYVNN